MRGSSTVVVKGSQAWDIIEPLKDYIDCAPEPIRSPVDDAGGNDADGKTPGWRKESKDIRNREPESNSDPFAP